MFNFREFIKRGFIDAVGKMPDYWVTFNAMGYFEKGVLWEEDVAEISSMIEAQYQTEEI